MATAWRCLLTDRWGAGPWIGPAADVATIDLSARSVEKVIATAHRVPPVADLGGRLPPETRRGSVGGGPRGPLTNRSRCAQGTQLGTGRVVGEPWLTLHGVQSAARVGRHPEQPLQCRRGPCTTTPSALGVEDNPRLPVRLIGKVTAGAPR